jgi:hypothetical protein
MANQQSHEQAKTNAAMKRCTCADCSPRLSDMSTMQMHGKPALHINIQAAMRKWHDKF